MPIKELSPQVEYILYKPTSREDYDSTIDELRGKGFSTFFLTGYENNPNDPTYLSYSPVYSRGEPVFTDGCADDEGLGETEMLIEDRQDFIDTVKNAFQNVAKPV